MRGGGERESYYLVLQGESILNKLSDKADDKEGHGGGLVRWEGELWGGGVRCRGRGGGDNGRAGR